MMAIGLYNPHEVHTQISDQVGDGANEEESQVIIKNLQQSLGLAEGKAGAPDVYCGAYLCVYRCAWIYEEVWRFVLLNMFAWYIYMMHYSKNIRFYIEL